MTPEQVQNIREKWISPTQDPSSTTNFVREAAAADVERLGREIDRLRQCCDEIMRQYVRLAAGAK
jgi:hypothetical protein